MVSLSSLLLTAFTCVGLGVANVIPPVHHNTFCSTSSRRLRHKEHATATPFSNNPRGGGAAVTSSVATTVLEHSVKKETSKLLQINEWTRKELAILLLGLVAGTASAAAMWFENGLLIDAVAWLCVICGSSTVVLQRKLTDFETMRELNNETREQVNVLNAANTRLSKQNKKLKQSTAKLQKAQSALDEISTKQGMTVSALVEQVEEYKRVQDEMKQSLKDKIRQTLLSVVMKSDADNDFEIDLNEMDTVCLRLNMLPNVEFNEGLFRKIIKKEGGSIVNFSKNHLSDDAVMAKEKVFVF